MAWRDLDKSRRLAVLIGVPVLLIAGIGYFTYKKLVILGPDYESKLPGFVLQDADTRRPNRRCAY